jgi:ParB family chromosome partitioning protein
MKDQATKTPETEPEASAVLLPFEDLQVSELNARTVIDEEAIKRLAENIRAHGLIQNLAGYRDTEGRIGIVAGGRRLRALALLQDDPRFQMVPVHVTDDLARAKAWAASENHLREQPHPADEIREFGRMASDGVSVPEIALTFGVSEARVHRRLKLAGLAEPILEALKADEITLGMAACFTLCDDQTHALKVLEHVRGAGISEHSLKRMLKPDAVKDSDRRAIFVGEEAYLAVGGRLTRDLFAEVTLYDDTAILDEVFLSKLNAAADDLRGSEGWKWVETCTDSYVGWHQIEALQAARVYPEPGEFTEAQAARYDALADLAETDALDAETEAELVALQDVLDGTFSEVQKALSGALIYVDQSGKLSACAGLVAKADRAAAEAAGILSPSRHGAKEDGNAPVFPAKLQADLDCIARAARQSALLDHPDLLLDLLAFQLAGRMGYRSAFGLRETDVPNAPEKMEGFAPDPRLAEPKYQPKDPWGSDLARAFRAYRKKGQDHIRANLTSCLAALVDVSDEKLGQLIDKEVGTDLRSIWSPTAEAFFKRLKSDVLDGLFRDLLDLEATHPSATTFARLKKGEKAERLEKLFSDPDYRDACGLTEAQIAPIDSWTPDQMG